ncbi:MAG: DpnI domain-containing protein [Pyrinomonadaceae bacterium]
MTPNQVSGNKGERLVAKLVPCPNCGKELMNLPVNYPLYDLQCSACFFRVQVKSSQSKPTPGHVVPGSGWDIMEKALKIGMLIPPLIVVYSWTENKKKRQKIVFYPFVPKLNLRKKTVNFKSGRVYKMFDFTNLYKLPSFVLYER